MLRGGHVDCSRAIFPAAPLCGCTGRSRTLSSNINDVTIMARAIVMPPIIEQFEWPPRAIRYGARFALDAGNNATGRALNVQRRQVSHRLALSRSTLCN